MIPLSWYLLVAASLFSIGLFGVMSRRNAVAILMCVELILLAVNINFVAFSTHMADTAGNNPMAGQIFALFILTVAAAEAAVGLAILVVYFRNRGNIAVENIDLMKG